MRIIRMMASVWLEMYLLPLFLHALSLFLPQSLSLSLSLFLSPEDLLLPRPKISPSPENPTFIWAQLTNDNNKNRRNRRKLCVFQTISCYSPAPKHSFVRCRRLCDIAYIWLVWVCGCGCGYHQHRMFCVLATKHRLVGVLSMTRNPWTLNPWYTPALMMANRIRMPPNDAMSECDRDREWKALNKNWFLSRVALSVNDVFVPHVRCASPFFRSLSQFVFFLCALSALRYGEYSIAIATLNPWVKRGCFYVDIYKYTYEWHSYEPHSYNRGSV